MRVRARSLVTALLITVPAGGVIPTLAQSQAEKRPMTFLDMQQMRNAGSPAPSPDGKWLLYTVSTPDWKEAKRQSDIVLVSLQQGVSSTKQLTFTKEKNETSPQWAKDGTSFFFLSNREAPENAAARNQVYLMRTDGGEARRVTDAKEGVSNYTLSPDGKWLVYRSGKSGEEQLYRMPVAGIESASAEQITRQPAGIGTWQWTNDSRRIYFLADDVLDKDEKARREKKFTVNIRNMETPRASLWALDLDPVEADTADQRQYLFRVGPFDLRRWQVGGLSWGVGGSLQAKHHAAGALCRPVSPRDGQRTDRAADEERRGRRKRRQLLARRQADRLLGAGRHGEVQHVECAAVRPRSRRAREAVPQAWRVVRRRRHYRFLVQGRQHDLFQRGHPRHQSADGARHQAEHRQAADQREGVAPGQSARRLRRPDRRILRRLYAIDDVHGGLPGSSWQAGVVDAADRHEPAGRAASPSASRKRSPGNPRMVRLSAACSSSRSATGPGNAIR